MNDLVFSVEKLFDDNNDSGCLKQTQCDKFYIASYQRGYKWGDEPIRLLFDDLYDAYTSSKNTKQDEEYYLQYITVKKVNNNLEIIDGQQRVTTLSILLSMLDNIEIIKDKIDYAVREKAHNYMEEFVYKRIDVELLNDGWSDFIVKYNIHDEQDIYYMFNAQVKFLEKFNEYLNEDTKIEFSRYIQNNVKLIVNVVESHISSELIFSNLNNNKVPLTNVDLVKGLFLTKLAREGQNSKSFKEILERRASLGRQWDEMENWLNRDEVKNFYFKSDTNGMEGLLELFIKKIDKKNLDIGHQYYIYNAIEKKFKTTTSIIELFDRLKMYYFILQDWYNHKEIYNLLGFILLHKGSKENIKTISLNFEDNKSKIISELKELRNQIIKVDNINELKYGDNNTVIHNILLSISVFGENSIKNKFNFYNFTEGKWSLEHIFPQNPKLVGNKLSIQDIKNINLLIDKNYDTSKLTNNEELKLKHENIDDNTIVKHYKEIKNILKNDDTEAILERLDIDILTILLNVAELHAIGNMALLTVGDNSSMSNHMFNYKRLNLTNRVSKGSFIPSHTFDVFSKLIEIKDENNKSITMNSNLELWSKDDIDVHLKWIKQKLDSIIKGTN